MEVGVVAQADVVVQRATPGVVALAEVEVPLSA